LITKRGNFDVDEKNSSDLENRILIAGAMESNNKNEELDPEGGRASEAVGVASRAALTDGE